MPNLDEPQPTLGNAIAAMMSDGFRQQLRRIAAARGVSVLVVLDEIHAEEVASINSANGRMSRGAPTLEATNGWKALSEFSRTDLYMMVEIMSRFSPLSRNKILEMFVASHADQGGDPAWLKLTGSQKRRETRARAKRLRDALASPPRNVADKMRMIELSLAARSDEELEALLRLADEHLKAPTAERKIDGGEPNT